MGSISVADLLADAGLKPAQQWAQPEFPQGDEEPQPEPGNDWEQPSWRKTLEQAAADVISEFVQGIFTDLDPMDLVDAAGLEGFDEDDLDEVAGLINLAVVELEIDFSRYYEEDEQ